MSTFVTPTAKEQHHNNFGSLRLIFATLVIIGHAPELIDGNRSRDFLLRLTGTIFSADVAVDGFFIISGYLIMMSFNNSRSTFEYLMKRVIRIYPGFIVAFLVSMFLFGSLAGGDLLEIPVFKSIVKIFLLGLPGVPGAFSNLPHPDLNGSMWTISYEFRCYLLVIAASYLLRHVGKKSYLVILVVLAALYFARTQLPDIPYGSPVFGSSDATARLTFMFFVGGAFYVWRDAIAFTGRGAALALAAMMVFIFDARLAEFSFAVFGSYLIFWYASARPKNRISFWMDRTDPSYGLYLYAWPIQNLLIGHFIGISQYLVMIITFVTALIFGLISWHCVEKPCQKLNVLYRTGQRRAQVPPGSARQPLAL